MMSAYSVDLRRRIASAVESGMSKAQAARTFSVSLSSVKRYVNKAEKGEPLAPKKRPGSSPRGCLRSPHAAPLANLFSISRIIDK
jgi:transposase